MAMLPAGATMTIVSLAGFVTVIALAIATLVAPGGHPLATGLWCLVAAPLAVFNLRRSIETMASFDWRVFVPVIAVSAGLLATFPGW